MAGVIETLAERYGDRLVFIRLREDLGLERDLGGTTHKFILPAQTPLPLTREGAAVLAEDDRVFPLPSLIQGLLLVLEMEEVLDLDDAPLPLYRAFALGMADDIVAQARRELEDCMKAEDWATAKVRALFLLNLREPLLASEQARDWAALAIAAGRLGQEDKALDWLDRAVALDADLAEAQAERGRLLAKQGRLEDAKAALLEARRARPSVAALYNLAQVCRQRGELTEARTFADEAAKAAPHDERVAALKGALNPPTPPSAE